MNESVSVDVAIEHTQISEISFYYMGDSGGLNVRCLENIIVHLKQSSTISTEVLCNVDSTQN